MNKFVSNQILATLGFKRDKRSMQPATQNVIGSIELRRWLNQSDTPIQFGI